MNRHVSNDGVTILLSLRAIHPVAKMIVEIAERQEQKVGDGTTTAVVLAAEMIKEGKRLIRELVVHPTKVVEGIESGVKTFLRFINKKCKKNQHRSSRIRSNSKNKLIIKIRWRYII